jgi:hypothetical protein
MVVLVKGKDKSLSGACSAFPVWSGQNRSATSIARKAGSESNLLEFPGAIPWRESFSALFGERLARFAILVMEHLAMVLGTAPDINHNQGATLKWASFGLPSPYSFSSARSAKTIPR